MRCYAFSQNCEKRLLASSCMIVQPHETTRHHWTDFHEIWYLSIIRKSVEKIQVSLNSGKNNGYCTWRPVYIYDNISLSSCYNENCFKKSCKENQNTRFMFNIYIRVYTACPRRNVPDFGKVFLILKYTDITQNTYVQSWAVTEIMAREVWNFDSCYTLIDYQIHIKTGRNMWFL